MKLTNKFNIPQTFVNVLERPTYSKGKANISATQLINSPKIVALTRKYEDELEQDVADMVWSIFGSAVHNILEHGRDENHIVEQRFHAEVEGWNISGAVDLQVTSGNGISIKDYKTTTAWSVMNNKIEWEYQLNIYAWLVEKIKQVPVTDVAIVAIVRDFRSKDAESKEGYPEAPIKEIPITLWTMEEREEFIKARIALHSACEFALETDGDLPDCTPDEMWEKPPVWAIRKIGGKRAHSLYDMAENADTALVSLGSAYEIEVRPGERTRCNSFCQVSKWCQQYQDYLKEKGNE